MAVSRSEFLPFARFELVHFVVADSHADEAQCWVADGGGHAACLAVFAFDQLEGDPAGGDVFAEANGGIAWRQLRLRFEEPRAAGQGGPLLDDDAAFELAQDVRCRDSFDFSPIFPFMGVPRLEQALVQLGFIA